MGRDEGEKEKKGSREKRGGNERKGEEGNVCVNV